MPPKINLIYSDTVDGVIGVNNDLYCKLSSDMKMFQKITTTKFNNKDLKKVKLSFVKLETPILNLKGVPEEPEVEL